MKVREVLKYDLNDISGTSKKRIDKTFCVSGLNILSEGTIKGNFFP